MTETKEWGQSNSGKGHQATWNLHKKLGLKLECYSVHDQLSTQKVATRST